MTSAPAALWLLLGEARSKCEHLAGVPLRPSVAKKLHEVYLAKGVHATNAIEGNTLSVEEVEQRIRGELELPPSKEYLGQETDNIVRACNAIVDKLLKDNGARPITPEQILQYNAVVLDGLNLPPEVTPGAIRTHSVGVASYRGAPAQDCEYLLGRLAQWLNDDFDARSEGLAIPILKAIAAHLYLAWIHPFGDGNGRTARLLEFHILVAAGVPTPAAHLLSNHYNQTRSEYYRQLEASSRHGGDPVPFIQYALRGFVDQLADQIKTVREQQFDVTWRNFVHETLKADTAATARQRHLVLDLSLASGSTWRSVKDVRHVSSRMAEAYASSTNKMIMRDLNALKKQSLVQVENGYVRANREIISAFLPTSVRKRMQPAPPSAPAAAPARA